MTIEGSVGYYCGGLIDGSHRGDRRKRRLGPGGIDAERHGHRARQRRQRSGGGDSRRHGSDSRRCRGAARRLDEGRPGPGRRQLRLHGGVHGTEGNADRLRRCRRGIRRFHVRHGLLCGREHRRPGNRRRGRRAERGGHRMPRFHTGAASSPRNSAKRSPPARDFKKVVAGRKLWNFDKREWKIWQEAL